MKPLLLEWQSEDLSREIRSAMTVRMRAHQEAEAAGPWTAELETRLSRPTPWPSGREAAQRLRSAVRTAGAPAHEALAALQHEGRSGRRNGSTSPSGPPGSRRRCGPGDSAPEPG
ncbi:hypothetical protein NKH77_45825 [Streptomyces sp. M19]